MHAGDATQAPAAAQDADAQGKGTVNPVVFSRKETFSGPDGDYDEDDEGGADAAEGKDDGAGTPTAASLVHQSDASGNQQVTHNDPNSPHASRGRRLPSAQAVQQSAHHQGGDGRGGGGLLSRLCCCLYVGSDMRPSQAAGDAHRTFLLPPLVPQDHGKKCLVLDLDETLVHSSFKPTADPDYVIPVDIEGTVHKVYVAKRPGVDNFMAEVARFYEVIVFTASLSKYANPLLDMLDAGRVIRHRLFREDCVNHEGGYVKDLGLLGRPVDQTIIVDNSPLSYVFHPQNAIGCGTFIDDMSDRELDQIAVFLERCKDVSDVREHMYKWNDWDGGVIPGVG